MVDGKVRGHLANAFLVVTPLVFVGALVLLRGRRHVAGDIAAASAERHAAISPWRQVLRSGRPVQISNDHDPASASRRRGPAG